MIHAGTIRIGSGRTVAVAGAYWINSIRRLRYTTLPGVFATSRPTTKASAPTGRLPLTARSASSMKFCQPVARLRPPVLIVRLRMTGLVGGKFEGANHVEELARRELDHRLMLFRNAANAGRGVVPPLLLQQEPLVDEIKRPFLPGFVDKSMVLRRAVRCILRFARPPPRTDADNFRTAPPCGSLYP